MRAACEVIEVDGAGHRAENWWPSQWGYKPRIVDWLSRTLSFTLRQPRLVEGSVSVTHCVIEPRSHDSGRRGRSRGQHRNRQHPEHGGRCRSVDRRRGRRCAWPSQGHRLLPRARPEARRLHTVRSTQRDWTVPRRDHRARRRLGSGRQGDLRHPAVRAAGEGRVRVVLDRLPPDAGRPPPRAARRSPRGDPLRPRQRLPLQHRPEPHRAARRISQRSNGDAGRLRPRDRSDRCERRRRRRRLLLRRLRLRTHGRIGVSRRRVPSSGASSASRRSTPPPAPCCARIRRSTTSAAECRRCS